MSPASWRVPPGWRLHYLPVTGSTNADAKRAARSGCPDLTVIVADEQLHGRGRLGREWRAPAGGCLLFSIVLRRPLTPVFLTAMCSVSVVEAIANLTRLDARVKWPNDVMLGDRKVCGVLTEVLADEVTIVGVGLNVNLDPMAAGLPVTATALSAELGREVPRGSLFSAIVEQVDQQLRTTADAPGHLLDRWEALLWRRWQEVHVDRDGQVLNGIVLGLSSAGALKVQDAHDSIVEVFVGDVLIP